MRKLIIIFLLLTTNAYADYTVAIYKDTGKIYQAQSNPNYENVPKEKCLEVMKGNVTNNSKSLNDIEVKIITDEEYNTLFYNTVMLPNIQAEKSKKEAEKQALIDEITTKVKAELAKER